MTKQINDKQIALLHLLNVGLNKSSELFNYVTLSYDEIIELLQYELIFMHDIEDDYIRITDKGYKMIKDKYVVTVSKGDSFNQMLSTISTNAANKLLFEMIDTKFFDNNFTIKAKQDFIDNLFNSKIVNEQSILRLLYNVNKSILSNDNLKLVLIAINKIIDDYRSKLIQYINNHEFKMKEVDSFEVIDSCSIEKLLAICNKLSMYNENGELIIK